MLDAAVAWDGLAAELGSAADSFVSGDVGAGRPGVAGARVGGDVGRGGAVFAGG